MTLIVLLIPSVKDVLRVSKCLKVMQLKWIHILQGRRKEVLVKVVHLVEGDPPFGS